MTNISLYDKIGRNYPTHRQADPRLTASILELLSLPEASEIADVGAGTGNYSLALASEGFRLKAIEPSNVMMDQRKQHTYIQWINGTAERLPLKTNSIDAAIGMLSFHHFKNAQQALLEMARVSYDIVLLFTFDPRQIARPWLADYFPSLWNDTFNYFPPIDNVAHWLGGATGCPITIHPFKLPHDMKDIFAAAGWRRPEMYLDSSVRSCMSGFAIAEQNLVEMGVTSLQSDLETGAWDKKYGWLREKNQADFGYRFVLSRSVG